MTVREQHEMICPRCKSDEHLEVTFTGTAKLTHDGTEDCGDHEYDSESGARCTACDWTGTVGQARKAYTEDEHEWNAAHAEAAGDFR